jgi:hypothetical protein
MQYEAKRTRPISNRQFARRMARHGGAVIALVLLSLAAGMWGYAHYEHLEWRDAFLNASMLLGGMGPVNRPLTPGGKVFAGCYALYAGLVFIVSTGVLLAPVVHRVIHHFHFADGNQS